MPSPRIVRFALVFAAACSQPATGPTGPIKDPVPMTETPSESRLQIEPVLDAYEQLRTKLSADDLAGSSIAARSVETSAAAAARAEKPDVASHLTAISQQATTLAAAADLTAARAAFGELSRHVVALIASDKALARGRHVFECPMVSGYRKWVQQSSEMANPYMGKQMLACGGESTWD
jgi:Cu(I)/Ag(I) efflux system membrane fusion protein